MLSKVLASILAISMSVSAEIADAASEKIPTNLPAAPVPINISRVIFLRNALLMPPVITLL